MINCIIWHKVFSFFSVGVVFQKRVFFDDFLKNGFSGNIEFQISIRLSENFENK